MNDYSAGDLGIITWGVLTILEYSVVLFLKKVVNCDRFKKSGMKKYLVTGAAGFIGANFLKYLLGKYGRDIYVVVLDKLTYAGNLGTIRQEIADERVRFVKGDIGNAELVAQIFAETDIDYVVNFAAESHVDRSITNPQLFLETNILGAQNPALCRGQEILAGVDRRGVRGADERL